MKWKFEPHLTVVEDFKVDFVKRKSSSLKHLFHFWLNVSFLEKEKTVLAKKDIDKICKAKKNKKYLDEMSLEINYEFV